MHKRSGRDSCVQVLYQTFPHTGCLLKQLFARGNDNATKTKVLVCSMEENAENIVEIVERLPATHTACFCLQGKTHLVGRLVGWLQISLFCPLNTTPHHINLPPDTYSEEMTRRDDISELFRAPQTIRTNITSCMTRKHFFDRRQVECHETR